MANWKPVVAFSALAAVVAFCAGSAWAYRLAADEYTKQCERQTVIARSPFD